VNPVLLEYLATGTAVEGDLENPTAYDSLLPPLSPKRLVALSEAIRTSARTTAVGVDEVRTERQCRQISRDALDTLAQAAIRHTDMETFENVREHLRHGNGVKGRWMAFALGIQNAFEI